MDCAQVIPFPNRRPVRSFEWWATNRRMLAEKTIEDYVYWICCARQWLQAHGSSLEQASHQDLLEFFDTLRPTYSIRKNVRCALVAYYAYLKVIEVRNDDPASALGEISESALFG